MAKTVEFYFDFGSPTTYLAYTQLPKIAARTGAKVEYVPFLLGGVFKATGNASPATIPAKGKYMGSDMARFAKRYGVPFAANPFFPINTLQLMRGAVAMQKAGRLQPYADALFDAMWVRPKNMGDPQIVAGVLTEAGFDAKQVMEASSADEVKETLKANTEKAIARDAFGAPTFFVGDEMFFGQDRLDFVEEALQKTR